MIQEGRIVEVSHHKMKVKKIYNYMESRTDMKLDNEV